MFERFTGSSREVVQSAYGWSQRLHHGRIGTEHFLLALLEPIAGNTHTILTDAGLTTERVRADIDRLVPSGGLREGDAEALEAIGIDIDAVRAKLEEAFGPGALEPPAGPGRSKRRRGRITPRGRKVLELSLRETIRLRQRVIAPEHILLGLIREGHGLAAKIMTDAGVDLDELRRRTVAALGQAAA